MSGVLKAVGTVFKKVLKVAKVVLPIALAVGAVVFTGGAALGLGLPTWGAAVASVFGNSTLGLIATGAVVQAGYGAIIGGVMAAAGGKDIMKGMQGGALVGAVTGGVTGAFAPGSIDPIGNAIAGGPVTGPNAIAGAKVGAAATTAPAADAAASGAGYAPNTSYAQMPGGVEAAAAPPGVSEVAKRGLSANGSFWSGAAGPIAGGAISGLGSGLGAVGAANADADAKAADRDAIAKNYAVAAPDAGLLTKTSPTMVANPNPGAPPMTPLQPGQWKYDTQQQAFVFVPKAA